MRLTEKSDNEIIDIAEPIWSNLVKSSNIKDYGGFTRDFSSQMLYGANEVELGKQCFRTSWDITGQKCQ